MTAVRNLRAPLNRDAARRAELLAQIAAAMGRDEMIMSEGRLSFAVSLAVYLDHLSDAHLENLMTAIRCAAMRETRGRALTGGVDPLLAELRDMVSDAAETEPDRSAPPGKSEACPKPYLRDCASPRIRQPLPAILQELWDRGWLGYERSQARERSPAVSDGASQASPVEGTAQDSSEGSR